MLIRYIISFLVFVAVDAIWLTNANQFYRQHIGHLMQDEPNLASAAVFYLLFLAGINLFVLHPHATSSYKIISLYGAAFGLVTYATFDLTSQAVFKEFPTIVVVVDLCWGMILSTSICVITTWIMRRFFAKKPTE